MTNQLPALSKQDLIRALELSRDEVITAVRSVSPEHLEEGRYENGWNARQILAHVASIEWTYPRLIDIARGVSAAQPEQAAEVKRKEPQEAAGIPTRTARGGILSYNDRQVEQRSSASVADLLEEFERNRAATMAAVQVAEDELMGRKIRSAGGITGPLAGVINAVAVLHVRGHLSDILGPSA